MQRGELYLRDDRPVVPIFIHLRLVDSSSGKSIAVTDETEATIHYSVHGFTVNIMNDAVGDVQKVVFRNGMTEVEGVEVLEVTYERKDGTQCEGPEDVGQIYGDTCTPHWLTTCVHTERITASIQGDTFAPVELRLREENGGVRIEATFDLASEPEKRPPLENFYDYEFLR